MQFLKWPLGDVLCKTRFQRKTSQKKKHKNFQKHYSFLTWFYLNVFSHLEFNFKYLPKLEVELTFHVTTPLFSFWKNCFNFFGLFCKYNSVASHKDGIKNRGNLKKITTIFVENIYLQLNQIWIFFPFWLMCLFKIRCLINNRFTF